MCIRHCCFHSELTGTGGLENNQHSAFSSLLHHHCWPRCPECACSLSEAVHQPAHQWLVKRLFHLCLPSRLMCRVSLSRRPLAPVTVLKLCWAFWECCAHTLQLLGVQPSSSPYGHPLTFHPSEGLGSPGNSWRKDSLGVNEIVPQFSSA